jgi:adenine-specific DNA-methyltransferase
MASLAKEFTQEKLFGQIYTPSYIVCKILDDIGYNSHNIIGKTIIDPACGDGRFLIEIVNRLIKYSKSEELATNLKHVWGWDIDLDAIEKCKENLNLLIKDLDISIKWNIHFTDSMKKLEKKSLFNSNIVSEKFDFIVGNPPYIRIQHLDTEQRLYIQNNYSFCQSGSTDIYIAFYELCLNLLEKNGVCGLITPNTFLFTETAKVMRKHFATNCNVLQVTNYGDIQLFNDATTYSAITIFNQKANDTFLYQKALTEITFEEIETNFSELKEPFWQLSIHKEEKIKGIKLKDICKIHVGITTLCDKVYIFEIENIDDNYVYALTQLKGKVKIEKSILKPIVKGSKLKSSNQKISQYVLFPYKKTKEKHSFIQEQEFKNKFPFAYDYLVSVRSELDKRDNGKVNTVGWYAFGRSQGLDTSFGKKIIFSPMNARPNFIYYENEDCTFYSGYCIKYSGEIETLLPQLNSDRMKNFVGTSSRDFRGGWKAYNKKVIENFEVEV